MKILAVIGTACISIGFFIYNVSGGFIATGFMALIISGSMMLEKEHERSCHFKNEKENPEDYINFLTQMKNEDKNEKRNNSKPEKPKKD